MEVANFTLLVDISSKLTGKTTQALDTLMKGQ
jgi:type III secretion system YscI/HrpB-like protein